jgi:hypothetical protein
MVGTLPYFPKISFFLNAVKQEGIQFQPDIPYDKRLHLNRMVIPGSNGLINLSIPILGGRNTKAKMGEVLIDNRYHWQRDHFRSISSVYGRSPYFVFYGDELKGLYETPVQALIQWNLLCLEWFLRKLRCSEKLTVKKISAEDFVASSEAQILNFGEIKCREYPQVFQSEIGFQSEVSALDALLNIGTPNALKILGLDI